MGSILGIINGAISLANKVVGYFSDKQQQDAGAAKQKAADQGAVLDKVTEAKDAENTVAASGDAAVTSGLQQWTRK